MRHIISILVENKFGVLARIAGMFSGRGFNIETLNVGPMPDTDFSRITATIIGDSSALDQAIKQVSKLVNVLEVTEFSKGQATERELLMLKINFEPNQRTEIVQICDIFRAKIIDVAPQSVNIEWHTKLIFEGKLVYNCLQILFINNLNNCDEYH